MITDTFYSQCSDSSDSEVGLPRPDSTNISPLIASWWVLFFQSGFLLPFFLIIQYAVDIVNLTFPQFDDLARIRVFRTSICRSNSAACNRGRSVALFKTSVAR